MDKTLHATFDGHVLRPDEPVPLEPGSRVTITIQPRRDAPVAARSFLRTARSQELDGPPDWSERQATPSSGGHRRAGVAGAGPSR